MGLGRLWSLPKTILNGTRPLVSGNDQTEVAHYALLPLNIWNSRLNVNAYANKLSSTRNEIALSRSAAWVIEKPMKQYHKYYIKYNNIPFYRNNIFFRFRHIYTLRYTQRPHWLIYRVQYSWPVFTTDEAYEFIYDATCNIRWMFYFTLVQNLI